MRIPDAAIAARAFEHAFRAVERVHRLMSRQDPDSDVARISSAAPGALV
jgi:thiamine biosynthesis lipoprotein ApbE